MKSITCYICKKVLSPTQDYLQHLKFHTHVNKIHSPDQKSFQNVINNLTVNNTETKCEICFKTYKTNKYLKIHMKYHNQIRDYKCPNCNVSFVEKSKLNRHIKSYCNLKIETE